MLIAACIFAFVPVVVLEVDIQYNGSFDSVANHRGKSIHSDNRSHRFHIPVGMQSRVLNEDITLKIVRFLDLNSILLLSKVGAPVTASQRWTLKWNPYLYNPRHVSSSIVSVSLPCRSGSTQRTHTSSQYLSRPFAITTDPKRFATWRG